MQTVSQLIIIFKGQGHLTPRSSAEHTEIDLKLEITESSNLKEMRKFIRKHKLKVKTGGTHGKRSNWPQIFKNILILINRFLVLHSLGASLFPIYVINPSAGETITSSVGIVLIGSLKK